MRGQLDSHSCSLFFSSMYFVCPVSVPIEDAYWHDDLEIAKEDALDWSIEREGENVIVYNAIENDDGSYQFNKLWSVFA